jgi:hypothetical protein
MKQVIYLMPDTCLECRYYQEFEYLENGLSKPIETPVGRGGTAKITVKLKEDGTKKYIARCGVYGGLIRVGGEMTKTYRLSMFSDEKQCQKEFPMDECTIEQIKSAM